MEKDEQDNDVMVNVIIADLGCVKNFDSLRESYCESDSEQEETSEETDYIMVTSKQGGTLGYIAPEFKKMVGLKSDIWSLGMTLLVILFKKESERLLTKSQNDPSSIVSEVPELFSKYCQCEDENLTNCWNEMKKLIENMMSNDYNSRYSTIDCLKFVIPELDKVGNQNLSEQYPNLLPIFKQNRYLCISALNQHAWYLSYLPEEFKNDMKMVMIAVSKNGYVLEYASDNIKSTQDVVLKALETSADAFKFCSEDLKNNPDFVKKCVSVQPWVLQFVSNKLKEDRDIIVTAVTRYGTSIAYAPDHLKSDREIVKIAVSQCGADALRFASSDLQSDRELVMDSMKVNGESLRHVQEHFKKDREVVLAALKQDGFAIKYCHQDLKNDREMVKVAVSSNGYVLEILDDSFKSDEEIVKLSISNMPEAIKFAKLVDPRETAPFKYTSKEHALEYLNDYSITQEDHTVSEILDYHKNDYSIICACLTLPNPQGKEWFSKIPTSRFFWEEYILEKGYNFNLVPEDLQTNVDFIKKCTCKYSNLIRSLPNTVRMNDEIMLDIIENLLLNDPSSINQMGGFLHLINEEFALKIVTFDPMLLKWLSEEYKGTLSLVLTAVSINGMALEFATQNLKENETVVKEALLQNPKSIIHTDPKLIIREDFLLPKTFDDYILRSNAFRKLDKKKEAVDDCNSLIELSDEKLKYYAYYLRGFNQEELDKSIEDLTVSIGMNNQYAPSYYELGCKYVTKCENDEKNLAEFTELMKDALKHAADLLSLSIKKEFIPSISRFQRAYCYYKIGDFEKAFQDLSAIISTNMLNPTHLQDSIEEALFMRGVCYFNMKNYQSAQNDFEKIHSHNPNHAKTWYYKYLLSKEFGNVEEAKNNLEKAKSLDNSLTE